MSDLPKFDSVVIRLDVTSHRGVREWRRVAAATVCVRVIPEGTAHHPGGLFLEALALDRGNDGETRTWPVANVHAIDWGTSGGHVTHSVEALLAHATELQEQLNNIVIWCGLAGAGKGNDSPLEAVKDLHAQLGAQIKRADAAEAEVARLRRLSLTCCWCNATFADLAGLKRHCTQCATHPVAEARLRQVEAERALRQEILDHAGTQAEVARLRTLLGKLTYDAHYDCIQCGRDQGEPHDPGCELAQALGLPTGGTT